MSSSSPGGIRTLSPHHANDLEGFDATGLEAITSQVFAIAGWVNLR